MEVNNIGSVQANLLNTVEPKKARSMQQDLTVKNETVANTEIKDEVQISGNTNRNVTANTQGVSQADVDKLLEESKKQQERFAEMITDMLGTQTEKTAISKFENFSNDIEGFKVSLQNGTLNVTQADIDQANADLAEDGYYGVTQTSDRLLDFAQALSGGDPSKIQELRDAVDKGFAEAAKMWGDDLPQISKDTYNATMEKFDKWAEESGVTLTAYEKM